MDRVIIYGCAAYLLVPMTASPGPQPARPVRLDKLSLVELHRRARSGDLRARAELDRLLGLTGNTRRRAPRTMPGGLPDTGAGPVAADTAAPSAVPDHARQQAEQLELIARLAEDGGRSGDLPRLIGLIVIAWGVLLAFSGLVLLVDGGSAFYLYCGFACIAVGVLLMRCSWWAAYVHGALLLPALVWAWHGSGVTMAALQSAPLLIPALWLALPAVRRGLR